MYKNIIYIRGNDSYGVEREVSRWIRAFTSKHTDINIDRYRLDDRTGFSLIRDNISMGGLFAEKRLFVFSGGIDRKSKGEGFESILESRADEIPEDHFLLFHDISEKEPNLIKWLDENADIRTIDTLWQQSAWEERSDANSDDIQTVLTLYREAESLRERDDTNPYLGHAIAHTLEYVTILSSLGQRLSRGDILLLCQQYAGDRMFDLVDAIMAAQAKKSIEILRRISLTARSEEWISSLIGLLRNNLYIKYLKHQNIPESVISSMTKIHPYVIKKGYNSRISYPQLHQLYQKIINTNIAYKRGKGLKESELGRIFSVELALMGLKK